MITFTLTVTHPLSPTERMSLDLAISGYIGQMTFHFIIQFQLMWNIVIAFSLKRHGRLPILRRVHHNKRVW